jgi:hypothetical protein
MSLYVFNDTSGRSMMNASGIFMVEFNKMIVDAELWTKPYGSNSFTRFIKVPINTCDIKRFKSNVLVKIVFDSLKKHSNWAFDCPQKPGPYYAYNFELSDNNVPLIFQSGEWYLKAFVKGAIKKIRGLKNIISIIMHGVYIHK